MLPQFCGCAPGGARPRNHDLLLLGMSEGQVDQSLSGVRAILPVRGHQVHVPGALMEEPGRGPGPAADGRHPAWFRAPEVPGAANDGLALDPDLRWPSPPESPSPFPLPRPVPGDPGADGPMRLATPFWAGRGRSTPSGRWKDDPAICSTKRYEPSESYVTATTAASTCLDNKMIASTLRFISLYEASTL